MPSPVPALDLTRPVDGSRPARPFTAPRAWNRDTLADGNWKVSIAGEPVAELKALMKDLRQQGLPLLMLDPRDFDLPACAAAMKQARSIVDGGFGFVVIDRLPMDEWTLDEANAAYWLLGRLFSRPVAQTQNGTVFRDVKVSRGKHENGLEVAMTDARLIYHNDNSANRNLPNFTGLLCVHPAREGGISEYCTLYSLYNAMAAEAPDQLDRLFEPFLHNRMGLQCEGETEAVSWAPGLSYDGDRLIGRLSANKITKGYAMAGVQMDNAAIDALECIQSIIPKHRLAAHHLLERGQIQIINNREGLHFRTEFTDGDRVEEQRHLVRLWFRDEGRPLFNG